jgi:hypothetical protein
MKQLRSIRKELAIAGAPRRVIRSGEALALMRILSPDEEIVSWIQGLYSEGLGLVIATNSRLLIINKSFFWQRVEDESYSMVNSVIYKRGVFLGKVILSTRARLYTFTTLKKDPIESFVSFIDSMMRATQPNQAPSSPSV